MDPEVEESEPLSPAGGSGRGCRSSTSSPRARPGSQEGPWTRRPVQLGDGGLTAHSAPPPPGAHRQSTQECPGRDSGSPCACRCSLGARPAGPSTPALAEDAAGGRAALCVLHFQGTLVLSAPPLGGSLALRPPELRGEACCLAVPAGRGRAHPVLLLGLTWWPPSLQFVSSFRETELEAVCTGCTVLSYR